MIILVDDEAGKALGQLCDIALKAGGLQNFKGIGAVLNSIKPLNEPEPSAEKEPELAEEK